MFDVNSKNEWHCNIAGEARTMNGGVVSGVWVRVREHGRHEWVHMICWFCCCLFVGWLVPFGASWRCHAAALTNVPNVPARVCVCVQWICIYCACHRLPWIAGIFIHHSLETRPLYSATMHCICNASSRCNGQTAGAYTKTKTKNRNRALYGAGTEYTRSVDRMHANHLPTNN